MTISNSNSQISFIFVETLQDTLIQFIQSNLQLFQTQIFTSILFKLKYQNSNQIKVNIQKQTQAILQLNQQCLHELKSLILKQKQQKKCEQKVSNLKFTQKDYKVLQQAMQKSEHQIRKHIGMQHQMKILIDELDQQIANLKTQNEDVQKQNKFYRKQISYLKQKEIQLQKLRVKQSKQIKFMKDDQALLNIQSKKKKQSRISNYQKQGAKGYQLQDHFLRKNIKNSEIQSMRKTKIVTQPSVYENQFMKQQIGTAKTKNHQKNNAKSSNNDQKYASKMGSKKQSQAKFIQGSFNVNLTNLVTIQGYEINDIKNDENKLFWNKRRMNINAYHDPHKNKQTQSLYKKYGVKIQQQKRRGQNKNVNKSVNISPRNQLIIQNTVDIKPQIKRRKIAMIKHKTEHTQSDKK